jgi:peptide/nickel transport system ATP-binding protein
MYQGRLKRYGKKSAVLEPPYDDYTALLLSSVPRMETGWLERVLNARP